MAKKILDSVKSPSRLRCLEPGSPEMDDRNNRGAIAGIRH
jgi:hypothetical protein